MMRALAILAVLAAPAAFGPADTARAADYTMRLHHLSPPVAAAHRLFFTPWTERVYEQSGKRLKIDIYPSMQLGGRPPQLIDQVRDGVVDMVWTLPGYTPGRFPRLEVFHLPFVHTTTLATNMALQDFQEMHLQEEFKDYKILLLHVHAGNVFIMRNKPLRRLEDFKGLKIRTPHRGGSWFIEAMGATAVGTPIGEVTPLLSRGVIDGALVPYEIIWPFKMHEMTKFSIDIPGNARVQTAVFFLGMHKKSYEKLPADLKTVLDDSTGRAPCSDCRGGVGQGRAAGHRCRQEARQRVRLHLRRGDRADPQGVGSRRRSVARPGQGPRHRRREGAFGRARPAGQIFEVAAASHV